MKVYRSSHRYSLLKTNPNPRKGDWPPGSWVGAVNPNLTFHQNLVYSPKNKPIAPENQWLEDVFPTKIVPFFGTC